MLVEKHLPMERRVETLRQAAESVKTDPFAALNGVARADDSAGVITRRDELGKGQEQAPALQPMFILPDGTQINVRMEPGQPLT